MNVKFLIFSVCYLVILSSCKGHKDHLFFIDDYDDFIFMAEDTNVMELDVQSSFLLTENEKSDANLGYIYKSFGEIYKTEKFKIYIIFSQIREPELNHFFTIRTFNNNNDILDSFCLSGYSFDNGEFCKGHIDKNLTIEKHCDDYDFIINKKINKFGKIVDSNKK